MLLLYPLNKKQQFPLEIFDVTNLNISETCFKTQCSKVDVTVKQNEQASLNTKGSSSKTG